MPPTDSMEKPPTVERTGRPIFLLQQLRAAAGAFFRAARSHAGDEAAPDQVQRIARFGTGGQCERPPTGRAGGGVCRQRHATGRRADRDGLRRASIRQFRPSGVAWESLQDCTLTGRWRGHREQGEFAVDRRSSEVTSSKVHSALASLRRMIWPAKG
jgi:hypothetical protein